MTWNANNKKNNKVYEGSLITPLLTSDAECEKEIKELNSTVFEFEKTFEDVKKYHEDVAKMSEKDYSNKRFEIHQKIQQHIPEMIRKINSSISKLENVKITDEGLKRKVYDSLKNVNLRIKPKQDDFSRILNEIVQKEKDRSDFSQGPISEKEMERYSIESNRQIQLRESDMSVKDLEFNEQIMKTRENELLEVQKVSAQIKDMTLFMQVKVDEQGKMIGKFNFYFKLKKNLRIM